MTTRLPVPAGCAALLSSGDFPSASACQSLPLGADALGVLPLAGAAQSMHRLTGDYTTWTKLAATMQLSWSGDCDLMCVGLSVVDRSVMGASQAKETQQLELFEEEVARRLLRRRAEANPFQGRAFTLGSGGEVGNREAQALQEAQATLEAELELRQRCREYCSNSSAIAVPFVLQGRVHLKSGRVSLEKTHWLYVSNSLHYEGVATALVRVRDEATGEESEMELHLAQVLSDMERAHMVGQQARINVVALIFRIQTSHSAAIIRLNTDDGRVELRPTDQQQDEAQPMDLCATAASPTDSPLSTSDSAAVPSFPDAPHTPRRGSRAESGSQVSCDSSPSHRCSPATPASPPSTTAAASSSPSTPSSTHKPSPHLHATSRLNRADQQPVAH